MPNSFLFIIPVTPKKFLTPQRAQLKKLCFQTLLNQTYDNWKALVIGETDDVPKNEKFILLEKHGSKEEKLQFACEYLKSNLLELDYLIRLDDDDIFNPSLLSEVADQNYDIFTDKYHSFWNPNSGMIAQKIRYWFPNTCIIKREHALKNFGSSPTGAYKSFRPQSVLIENEHHEFHLYFNNTHKIFFSKKNNPIYIRTLNQDSITYINSNNHNEYMNKNGIWKKNNFPKFKFLRSEILITSGSPKLIKQSFKAKLKDKIEELIALKNYKRVIISKHKPNQVIIESSSLKDVSLKYYESQLKQVRECKRCILNSHDDPFITFNDKGECNYCQYYDKVTKECGSEEEKKKFLSSKIAEIKNASKGKEYDCILGVSGGVDSSFLAYWAKENGLRPLIVHFDNGWNSELAVENIRKICDKLGFSLQTYVINWEEFKNLQIAYLKAGVIDIEVLTDHAVIATIYKIARKYGLRYTINGFNYASEAIMPKGWVFDKTDFLNIKDINDKYGSIPIKTFPHLTFSKRLWYTLLFKMESLKVLNYIDYNKENTKTLLKEKLDWVDYGGKHYESVFTKFYQAYILPTKFGVDKRRAHLANLICSGQITREMAFEELKVPLYAENELRQEKEYILKKFGMTEEEFDKIMAGPIRKHKEFKTEAILWQRYFRLLSILKLRFK